VKAFLDNKQQVATMRHIMKNVLAHAIESRLNKLRDIVKIIQIEQLARPFAPSRSSSLRLAQGNNAINIPPLSPQSLSDRPSHPPKKR
jgi:hypothetical protein